jgi:hypothetical protein
MTLTINITRRTAILMLAAIGALLLVTFVAGCSQKQQEQFKDAPTGARDTTPVEVYDNGDGFSNWSEKCDKHGNRVFVAFHSDGAYAAITAIKDPTCATG